MPRLRLGDCGGPGRLQIAQHRVDRLELRQLDAGRTAAGDDALMLGLGTPILTPRGSPREPAEECR